MDITAILSGIKGTVLDAKHIELLKHAYELQNQNIEQLKNNNDALKEKAGLLEEKAALLEKENESLKAAIKNFQTQEPTMSARPSIDDFSENAMKILKLYRTTDKTALFLDEMKPALGITGIQVASAINELRNAGIIDSCCVELNRSPSYSLTEVGTHLVLQIASS